MAPRDSFDRGVMFSLMHVSIKLVPYVQVSWQHWTSETMSISSNRLISLVKPTAGSQPLLLKLLFKHFFSGEHTAGTSVSQFGFYLYMHFPQIYINIEQESGGGQGLSICSFYSVFIQHFSADAFRALCNPLCHGSHRKVICGWERENHCPKCAEDSQSHPGYLNILHMAVPAPPKACAFAAPWLLRHTLCSEMWSGIC